MSYLVDECTSCEGERYVENGAEPCARCNPPGPRLSFDEGQRVWFLTAGPVEVTVGGRLFDVELVELEGAVVIPGVEA